MRKLACVLVLAGAVTAVHASSFAPGNLVIMRIGDGSAPLTSVATASFLDEYTPSGTLVQTIPMPTAVGPWGKRLTNSGTATSEGALTRSVDGLYLTLMGYDADVLTASIASTTNPPTNRVVGRVDYTGAYDTTTALTDAFSAGNPRSAVTTDGTQIWAVGSNSGARYTTFGGTTSTQLATSPTNLRVVNIFGGQLYVSSATGAFQGVSTVGTGLPTTSGQTITLLPGFPTTSGPSPYDFYFFGASTLYVADDRTTASGGLQKWTFSGATWTLAYTLNAGLTSNGLRGLTGTTDGQGNPVFYATTADNKLVTVTDTGAGSSFTILATAGTYTAFRGVDFSPIPEPSSLLLLGLGVVGLVRRR